MATSTGAFLAGIGTTFAVLAVGFGGGLMMAKSALKESGGYQARVTSEALTPVRVILPNSAEAAQPPQQPHQQASSPPEPATQTTLQPAKQLQAPVEKVDTRKPEAEERERKRRYVERKARRQAEARAREQREQQKPREREDAPIMAFGGDSLPRFGGGLFGN
jgi:hypothetical protein